MADYSGDFDVSYTEDPASCTIRFRCFDTPNSVRVFGCAHPDEMLEDLLIALRRMCLDLHRLWSFSLPGSDIVRLNAPATGPVEVDECTAELLAAMKRFHDEDPRFDFTIGPASYLWKVATRLPAEDEIARAMEHVGAEKVSLEGREVRKADPLVSIDVGGAAKGFAADAVVARLRQAGVASADIDLGGNLFMMGRHPAGRPWRVAVRIPEGVPAKPVVIDVEDRSVVTSGIYERFVEIDGMRFHHIIDASTGWPAATDLVSATVVSESSLQADLLATTALLAGSSGLPALKARHPACTFIAIALDGTVLE